MPFVHHLVLDELFSTKWRRTGMGVLSQFFWLAEDCLRVTFASRWRPNVIIFDAWWTVRLAGERQRACISPSVFRPSKKSVRANNSQMGWKSCYVVTCRLSQREVFIINRATLAISRLETHQEVEARPSLYWHERSRRRQTNNRRVRCKLFENKDSNAATRTALVSLPPRFWHLALFELELPVINAWTRLVTFSVVCQTKSARPIVASTTAKRSCLNMESTANTMCDDGLMFGSQQVLSADSSKGSVYDRCVLTS